jgi:CPA1 family monovalent cation:H+ antiporter
MADAIQRLVLVVTILLFIAAAVAAAVKRVRLPYTVALVATGAVLAVLGRRAVAAGLVPKQLLDSIELTPGVILYVLLPILLFEAAFNLDSRRLIKNLLPITVLAVPAVVISTVVVGVVLYLFGGVPHDRSFTAALLFGALISTTDAIAVVAIFRELGAPQRLQILVEGEALFNSGTALVLFNIIAVILIVPAGASQDHAQFLLSGLRAFAWMGFGGLAVGILTGFVFSWLLGAVEDDPLIEITLTTICAPLSFLLAGFLGVSDVISVIGAGLTVGNYGRPKISPAVLAPLAHYWHYLAFVANSIIFLLVGFSLRPGGLISHAGVIAVAIVAVLVGRAAGIFPVIPLVNRFVPKRIQGQFQVILWWGGMRGALVLVMALSLSQFDAAVLATVGPESSPGWAQCIKGMF